MEIFDVIIIGGGPAGISAAKGAAMNGANTILFEKQASIMALKACGEATSQQTFETAGISEKPSIVLHKADAMVFSPNMKYIHINQIGFSINKTLFLQELAASAADFGAQIRVREEFQSLKRNNDKIIIKTNRGEYETSIVIGADGFNSNVARTLGIEEKSEAIPTVQYTMVNCKLDYPNSVRFYLGNKIAPKGYAWIFPKGDKITEVGIGVRGFPAKSYLDSFIKKFDKELGNGQIIDYRGAPVPIGGIIKQNIVDGAILIGDAAGMVIPLTGAGIHSSVASGLIAGEVAASSSIDRNHSKNRLKEFKEKYDKVWGTRIEKSLKAMRAIESLNDNELNTLQKILRADDILDLANGFDLKKTAMKLIKYPSLAIKLAKKLL